MSKTLDLKDLRVKAEAATPGPWAKRPMELHLGGFGYEIVDIDNETVCDDQTYYNSAPSDINAEFIAAANPEVVLELLDRIEDLMSKVRFCATTELDTWAKK